MVTRQGRDLFNPALIDFGLDGLCNNVGLKQSGAVISGFDVTILIPFVSDANAGGCNRYKGIHEAFVWIIAK